MLTLSVDHDVFVQVNLLYEVVFAEKFLEFQAILAHDCGWSRVTSTQTVD